MIKHIGIHKNLGVRYVVVFREVPNEPESCLVIESDSLNPLLHDNLMSAIESTECQGANNLGEALARKSLTSGENMLSYFHDHGLIKKISIDEVILTPTPGTKVGLREINNILNGKDPSEGVKTSEAAPVVAQAPTTSTTSNESIELAKKLLEQAMKLDPSLVGTTLQVPAPATVKKIPRRRRQAPKA